ncbi:340_t:CDS:2 [Paraglomus brasilianum]|uniref:340_t:CDS:1 n=1 Tax=Paraglomus brasilianum TaxID=144538 RepID=A0A9N9E260_9GLOM|nr:340_t:CDS:2 [Paraglomus brasilianum]
MDYMGILGETMDLIAKEKAGILKPKGKTVFAPPNFGEIPNDQEGSRFASVRRELLVDGVHNIPAASALRSFIDNEFDKIKPIHWLKTVGISCNA